MDLSLDLKQRIDARFGDEQVLAIHFQHHKSFLVKRDQAPSLSLRLSPPIGVGQQVCSAQHDHPSLSLAHRATPRPMYG
jgi:hypothetical protein